MIQHDWYEPEWVSWNDCKMRWILSYKPAGVERCHVSKTNFRLGGMTLSEWTRSFRAIRDNQQGITLHLPSTPHITLHIALLSQCAWFFSLCQSPIINKHGALWPTVATDWNGFIGYTLASGLQCDGWHCANSSSHSFCLHTKSNSLFRNYTHHSMSPDQCGCWKSIACLVRLQSYY